MMLLINAVHRKMFENSRLYNRQPGPHGTLGKWSRGVKGDGKNVTDFRLAREEG
jgi:hypothetical protein